MRKIKYILFLIIIILSPALSKGEGNKTIINQNKITMGGPINIQIPSIHVDAKIESLGLNKKGAMDSPVGLVNTGWYNGGPRPGDVGSAVIDGHSGWKNGAPAAFDNLKNIKIGDRIYTTDIQGKITIFIVKEIKKYKPNADPTKIFVSSDDLSHLNLITCTGLWNIFKKTHEQRLVVFSDRVE